jgi:hypothetical protein
LKKSSSKDAKVFSMALEFIKFFAAIEDYSQNKRDKELEAFRPGIYRSHFFATYKELEKLLNGEKLKLVEKEDPLVIDSGFDPKINGYSFQNISTKLAGGLCAGFAWSSVKIYNKNQFKLKDTYNPGNSSAPLSYDMEKGKDKYMAILSGNLYSYTLSDSKVEECPPSEDPSEYTSPDSEVIKMLQLYWSKANENCGSMVNPTRYFGSYDNYSLIKKLEDMLKGKKVFSVCVYNTQVKLPYVKMGIR